MKLEDRFYLFQTLDQMNNQFFENPNLMRTLFGLPIVVFVLVFQKQFEILFEVIDFLEPFLEVV